MAYAYGYGSWSLISDSRQHVQCIIGQDPRVVSIDRAMPSILFSFILKEPQINCATFPSVMEGRWREWIDNGNRRQLE